ncbi:glycerophosphodiester phosphodiesterase [Dokdonia sinensis]|nr:glycerophosphodiester phosphodiesterase [Dokdonia sinensis]
MTSNKIPIVIAHRGAQSIFPEHTLEGYKKAIELGADYIEPDLVMTKDGVLVARHEPYISKTTDVADRKEFKNRKTTKVVDGIKITDWFVSNFTLKELKTLRARQPWPKRPQEHNDIFEIPTFEEIVMLAKQSKTKSGKPVGIYPELKHPTFHKDLGLPMEDKFLDHLKVAGWTTKDAPVYVQCFEVASLQYLNKYTDVKLIQLIGATCIQDDGTLLFTDRDGSYNPEGQPYDFYIAHDTRTYQFYTTEEGMKFTATYADGLGPWKPFIISHKTNNEGKMELLPPSDFVYLAHKYNLKVHPYTFRNEDDKWRTDERPESEYELFFQAGVDGVFSDYTDIAVKARYNHNKKTAQQ